ncbi:MAG: ABC transporter permease [Planctomycetes bacterium]|nr:ABC transporter permease [Planctomycetota bacterium]
MSWTFKILDILRLGFHSLGVHKVRSGLTALGVFIGVCGVISMLAINQGASAEAQRTIQALGSDNIIINSVKPPQRVQTGSSGGRGALCYGLTLADVECLREAMPGIVRSVIVHRTLKYAYYNGRNLPVVVIGTEPAYRYVVKMNLAGGRFISDADVLRHKPYCVLTLGLAERLFGFVDPVGKCIRIGGEPFVVVGVLTRLPQSLLAQTGQADNYAIIPITTERDRFGEYTVMWTKGSAVFERVEISQVIFQMADENAVIDGVAVARNVLPRTHAEMDYETVVPLELIEQKKKQMFLWNVMLVTIASVSLLVGGIGIMNIMLATVVERTREIGVRRALGAKRLDIVAQFLVESVVLTTIGGAVGIVLGISFPWLIERFLGFPTVISAWTLILPFLMAVLVGLVSGLYPAMRAAALSPIAALRHE